MNSENAFFIKFTYFYQDSDDLIEELPKKKIPAMNRKSISAEPSGKFNKQENFIPKIITKSEEQKKKYGFFK